MAVTATVPAENVRDDRRGKEEKTDQPSLAAVRTGSEEAPAR
jgi:hypothetical protein